MLIFTREEVRVLPTRALTHKNKTVLPLDNRHEVQLSPAPYTNEEIIFKLARTGQHRLTLIKSSAL